jgi:hypothetical protein
MDRTELIDENRLTYTKHIILRKVNVFFDKIKKKISLPS